MTTDYQHSIRSMSDAELHAEANHVREIVSMTVASVHGVLTAGQAGRWNALQDEMERRGFDPRFR